MAQNTQIRRLASWAGQPGLTEGLSGSIFIKLPNTPTYKTIIQEYTMLIYYLVNYFDITQMVTWSHKLLRV